MNNEEQNATSSHNQKGTHPEAYSAPAPHTPGTTFNPGQTSQTAETGQAQEQNQQTPSNEPSREPAQPQGFQQQDVRPPDFAGHNQDESPDIVNTAHKLDMTHKKMRFIKFIVLAIILSIGAVYLALMHGFPWIAALGVIAVAGVILFLNYKQLQKAPDHIGTTTEAAHEGTPPSVADSETLQYSVAGIMSTSGVRSTSQLGYGDVKNPHNAMLVTDQAVYFIYVPMTGGDQVVNNTDIGAQQWMWAHKKIQEKLDEMKQNSNLQQIIGSDARNTKVERSSLTEVKFSKLRSQITLKTDQEKYAYAIRQKDDFKQLRQLLG